MIALRLGERMRQRLASFNTRSNGLLDVGYGGFWKMRSMEFNVLVGIFVLVVVTLIGLSIAGAPKYPAGYPADRMTSSQ
jgi:hypothetical protein